MNDVPTSAPLFANDAFPGGNGAPSAPPGTGVIPYQGLQAMIGARQIKAGPDIAPEQVQPSSIDLRLGRIAWRVRASFLPGPNSTVAAKVKELDGHAMELSDGGTVLEKECVYVVELEETLDLPSTMVGFANPKSSTGRLDVLTRLITNRSSSFDQIEAGYKGPLYVEVAPQTFSVVARRGTRLNQIRFQRGAPVVGGRELQRLYDDGQLLVGGDPNLKIKDNLVPVTIDLKGKGRGSLIGYRAKRNTQRIDLDRIAHYDPGEFWEPIRFHREPAIILDPNAFYILMTREEVGVPPTFAAEMVPYDTRSGEYRVHYAGFFDPGFGWAGEFISGTGWRGRAGGSRAVLEVRSHEVPFMLEDEQIVGWLRYDRMAGIPDRLYGSTVKSNYQNQTLALAKHFRVADAVD